MTRTIPQNPIRGLASAASHTDRLTERPRVEIAFFATGHEASNDGAAKSRARPAIGAIAGSLLIAGGLFMATAADVCAPEPAHLNGSLEANGSTASATLVNSGAPTTGFRWSGSWAVGGVPGGTPCATYAASAGTVLYSTIQASGSYRRCL